MFKVILCLTLVFGGCLGVMGVIYHEDRALALEIRSVFGFFLETVPFLGSFLLLPVLACMAVYYLVRWDWKKLILVLLLPFVLFIGHLFFARSSFPV